MGTANRPQGAENVVRRLTDMVAWQKGAVISRALIKKMAGTVRRASQSCCRRGGRTRCAPSALSR